MDVNQESIRKVSVHGGHSGQFCCHAVDTLEDIVLEYIRQGFTWVGLTEHMAAKEDRHLYPEEAEAGFDAKGEQARFADYFKTAKELKAKYSNQIEILVGFETEFYLGYESYIQETISTHQPDYFIGSLHHVHDVLIDGPRDLFNQAISLSGGLPKLYIDYFDRQFELIHALSPPVVSHFDLIRLNDPNYQTQLQHPEVWKRITRNLELIAEKNLILDLNLRALKKGQPEPYISKPILEYAKKQGIAVVPGDDSHGVKDVGNYFDVAVETLLDAGFSTDWKKPA